ncbi:hypothetical protein BJX65DRAFT_263048 [Aspergillus insuetus]
MSSTRQLPNQVLCMILWHYRNDEDGNLVLPCLLASRRLHDITISILYRHIAIEIHVTGNLPISSDHLRHTKYFSVYIESQSLSSVMLDTKTRLPFGPGR